MSAREILELALAAASREPDSAAQVNILRDNIREALDEMNHWTQRLPPYLVTLIEGTAVMQELRAYKSDVEADAAETKAFAEGGYRTAPKLRLIDGKATKASLLTAVTRPDGDSAA